MAVKLVKKHTARQRAKVLETQIKTQTKPVLTEGVELRKNVTNFWSKAHQPVYFTKQMVQKSLFKMTIWGRSNEAERASISVYNLLDQGTKVNYARMSNPFSPKTAVNSLQGQAGQGGFAYLGAPLEGIDARNFNDNANVITDLDMRLAIDRGFKLGFKKL